MVDINIIREDCFLDEILNELPNRVSKPTPAVKGKNLKTIFHQFSDSLKDIHLQYTCVDASSIAIALGTNVGNVYVYQRVHKNIIKISSETKYVPTTCIKLASGCTAVAFGHESGTFSVGLVDPPMHKSFDSLTTQDIHHSRITCLEWSTDALILYVGDGAGNISMSVVKISEGILQTAIIVTEDSSVVQLSYGLDALLISTLKRTALWPFQTETLVQVGEKERKTSGGFGCCFMPDTLQEPTKKLYAARPGLRIWTADENGKVSSTLVFKSLLANKPQVVRTLIAHDDKANSNGQFGKLLIYCDQYVTTWDQNHIWVLDLDIGNIIGCHSNLGKIRDVAVCGHEIFVLNAQRERFLRRFILCTERVLESSCLDAVIAGKDEPSTEISDTTETEKTGFSIASALISAPLMSLEIEESGQAPETKDKDPEIASSSKEGDDQVDGATVNIFEKINSIPLDEEQGDIVFTAAKKKKKKRKHKASTQVEETETLNETQNNTEPSNEPGTPPVSRHNETKLTKETATTSAEEISNDVVTSSNLETVSPTRTKYNEEVSSTERDSELESLVHILDGKNAEGEMGNEAISHVPDQRVSENNSGTEKSSDTANTNDSPNVNKESAPLRENHLSNEAAQQETTVPEASIEINTSTKQQTLTANEAQTAQETIRTPNTEQAPETPEKQTEISNSDPSKEGSLLSRQDSSDPTDVYRSSDDAFHGLDSHEDDRHSSGKPDATLDKNVKPKRDNHVPLLPDTWSARALPTNQTIEHVSISQKYIFCVDNRNGVYFANPNTASSAGWEKADFTAKHIYVNSACDFICFVKNGKAFIRGNISDMNPVGNASFQILDEVSQLATCSTCSWALTAGDSLKRADTAVLAKLKGNLKSCSIWKHFETAENPCQIACYDNVLWARNLDETLVVRAGRSGGRKTSWKKQAKKAKWINMSDDGTLWIITPDDQIWFKQHVSASCPSGEVWYQVTVGQYIIDDPSVFDSTFNFFSSVSSAYRSSRTTEYLRNAAKGLLQSTKDMAFSLFREGDSPKQIYCNMHCGVWLLDTKNALHACRSQATGTYWEMVCPTGTAKSAIWRDVTTGLVGYVWAIQPNGDLTCFHPNGPAYNVECPSSHGGIDFISGSPYGVWCFASEKNTKFYIRDGISESYPQGFAWKSSSVHQQEITNIRHFSVGGITVWAVDNNGHVWVRIGSLDGEESKQLAQAWLPIECDKNIEFTSIEVNGKDSMVWAVDTKGNVYARESVREDLIIGEEWRQVVGVSLKSVCLSSYLVYGLCTTGEIVCRFGVSDGNCIGDYWKKIPGSFSLISVNSAGELWAINEDEKLYARKMKCLVFSRGGAKEGREGEDEGKGVADDDGGHDNKGGDDIDDVGDWEML